MVLQVAVKYMDDKRVLIMTIKTCTKCKLNKTSDKFGKRKASLDGLKSWCKLCESEAAKLRRLNNPEKAKLNDKKFREKSKEKRSAQIKAWRDENKEHINEYRKKYRQRKDIIEKRKIQTEKYRRKKGIPERSKMSNGDRLKKANIRAKQYYALNKQKINERKKKWINNKQKTDIAFKIKCRLSKRVWDALKGNCKSARAEELLGCSVNSFISYLENKFDAKMSWDNYGEWHIDHIKPCKLFNLENENEQRQCFNYKNLQPLWAFDNMSKGAKYEPQPLYSYGG